jgi:acyl-CoA reductase-like NAD-dependent aldehyde dehydrogenase
LLKSVNPSTEELIAVTRSASAEDYQKAIEGMVKAKGEWMKVPMPARGDIVRQIG